MRERMKIPEREREGEREGEGEREVETSGDEDKDDLPSMTKSVILHSILHPYI